mmetsp:Transcript_31237/g.47252  ORF Transcript_31237/g.47252 Transcript_31237/m.47252 type:complete len:85 (+) Transcript_31237:614-868(+)
MADATNGTPSIPPTTCPTMEMATVDAGDCSCSSVVVAVGGGSFFFFVCCCWSGTNGERCLPIDGLERKEQAGDRLNIKNNNSVF